MRIAVLVKQVPAIEEMALGSDGRLIRSGTELEMNAYCRRAVSQGVELASQNLGCSLTVLTLGPPSAEDVLREAIAWGLQRQVDIDALLITDPKFAGSDTLATARAIAAALNHAGPFDLVLCGKNSIDADTGQVPPQVAELLDLPFATAVKRLSVNDDLLMLGCELDDQWVDCEIALPAVLSCAERLCEPAKVPEAERALVPAERIRTLDAQALGLGPWGQAGSPTRVGATKVLAVERQRHIHADLPIAEQVRQAVQVIAARGGFDRHSANDPAPLLKTDPGTGKVVAVVAEPDRLRLLRELLGEANRLANLINGSTAVLVPDGFVDPLADSLAAASTAHAALASYGADHIVRLNRAVVEEDVADAVTRWAGEQTPWAILAPSTAFGREVAARLAVRFNAGLTGDVVGLDVSNGRLVAYKPAFGGQLVTAIHTSSAVQLATVRAGVLPIPSPRDATVASLFSLEHLDVRPKGRVKITARKRDDDIDLLAEAAVVVGVGQGVHPSDYSRLAPLVDLLGAELGCTRKVTDNAWLPHARQIGITGRSIAPRLYVMIGASGKFNHTIGIRAAQTVLAITNDLAAPAWQHADATVVGDWQDVVPALTREIAFLNS